MKAKAAFKVALVLGLLIMLNKKTEPRGIRNNNPTNIRIGINWDGAVGDDGAFIKFSSAVMGIRAAARILRTYRYKYGLDTVAGIINRWAPPIENDTESYINSVSLALNVEPETVIYDEHYPALIAAIIKHENGKQPYSMEDINQGFKMGFMS